MDLLLDRLIDGFNNGVIYGFLGLAFVCVYRGSGHLNMAQGEMAMFSGFIAYSLYQIGFPVVGAVLASAVIAFVAGLAIERTLVRPFGRGHASDYPVLMITVALFLAINSLAGVIWGGEPLAFPAVVPAGPDDYVSLFGSRLRYQSLAFVGVLVAVLAALWFLFYRTRVGLAMRTATSNPESAQLVGIRVSRMSALGWGMAAFIGALIGSLVAPSTTLTTGMMFNFLIYAVVAATLGGFDSPPGVVVAGIAIGIFENLVASYVSIVGSDLKQAVALMVMLVVLMVRPYGLFGTPKVERV